MLSLVQLVDYNFYHWLLEALPKLVVFLEVGMGALGTGKGRNGEDQGVGSAGSATADAGRAVRGWIEHGLLLGVDSTDSSHQSAGAGAGAGAPAAAPLSTVYPLALL